jgi:signal transduction histidine kinase
MELRLREALTKAEESDRLKSAFLANISHEIRTPMNAIMGFSELLERPGITREKKLEFTQHLRLRCQDLLSMIDDILYMSRIQAGHLSISYLEGNIDELMDKLIFSIQSKNHYMNEKEIEFRKINMLDPSQYRVRLDFRGLFQVLSNLLSNALKFTNKGFIELTCRMESANVLEFVVKDTGIGIDNEKLKDVFKLFRQADHAIHEHYGGSGLGLSVCKGLVELWGGKMWAESTVNEGSAFYFTVPFVR